VSSAPTALQLQRWFSRTLAGDAQHVLIARIRPGYMNRGYLSSYRLDTGSPIFPPLIWKGHNHNCWQGQWTPTGGWVRLPHVVSAEYTRSFDTNGSSSLTLVMDNIAFVETEGVTGLYHTIVRGYYAPQRGLALTGRKHQGWAPNSWRNVLNAGWQIELWEGYGQGADVELRSAPDQNNSYAPASGALSRTWTGIIEQCELVSHPDQITLTARDFGVLLTDQRVMGNVIAAEITPPVTFADRRRTQGETKISAPLSYSSGSVSNGVWTSQADGTSFATEWIEITLPAGYYEDCYIAPQFDQLDVYLSLYANGPDCNYDRVHPMPAGWVDFGRGKTPNGTPYIRHLGQIAASPTRRWSLGNAYTIGDGSKLRFTFTNLQGPNAGGLPIQQETIGVSAYAGTNQVATYQFGSDPLKMTDTQAKHWILIEDVSEIVRMVLIWAGFKEWNVDDFGWSLYEPMQYSSDHFLIDIINDYLQQGAYVFYVGAPSNNDASIGIPHFVRQMAINATQNVAGGWDTTPRNMIEVRGRDMTETMDVKWDLSNLPYVMRVRGQITTAAQGGQTEPQLGYSDESIRYMATYFPPWSGQKYLPLGPDIYRSSNESVRRVAGILRHFTQTYGISTIVSLYSNDECLYACVLAAIQYALAECTAQFQLPGLPGFDLNTVVSVIEEATATNTRVWIASVDSKHTLGPEGSWHMTISGAVLDTEDMDALIKDWQHAYMLAQGRKAADASAAANIGVVL
jgi:hypothetical protein